MWSRLVMSQVKHNSWFIAGVVLGLWLALAVIPLEEEAAACAVAPAAVAPDDFEPRREEKPPGAGRAAARALQRPRYYSTELGMRGSLLVGVLSSEEALKDQVPALNRTLARLQPALKFFITASAMSSMPGLANVVGFTDTREMLKPFHALKYMADNYLEEYSLFFLVTDGGYVNARRLAELAARLSASQDLYMGEPAADSQYCSLESGILLSNSVLRAVHGSLEWCVRNSYSPHHHENVGRCVLHAAHVGCAARAQGVRYVSAADGALAPALADAVTVRGARARRLAALHAYAARAGLQRGARAARRLRAAAWAGAARAPPGYRNGTWPGGLRADAGLAPPPPDSRFSHLRWTAFNHTHAFMPDEVRAVAPLSGATRAAVELVVEEARAWARRRWGGAVSLVEGAWQWEPAAALRYRLLLRHAGEGAESLRLVEVARALGAARLVPVRYVTESARVWLLVPVVCARAPLAAAAALLRRWHAAPANTRLLLAAVRPRDAADDAGLRAAVRALAASGARVQLLDARVPLAAAAAPEARVAAAAARAALAAAGPALPPDALVLLAPPHLDYNQDFLNRVRMNTLAGEQWFLPLPFARHAQYAHPRFAAAHHTGRFRAHDAGLAAFYKADYDDALAAWRGASDAPVASVLAAAALRCVRAPEPGAVLAPRPAPCAAPAARAACLRDLRADGLDALELGERTELARLLLETQAERA